MRRRPSAAYSPVDSAGGTRDNPARGRLMRVTIDHREVLSAFGRIHFYIDCTVQFSEAERAVIRNRQLGDHSIQVGGAVPRFRHLRGFAIANGILWLTTFL